MKPLTPILISRPRIGGLTLLALNTLLITFTSCSSQPPPQNKQIYLEQFRSFMQYTNRNCNKLEEEKFMVMDVTFELLSEDFYEQFYDKLTPNEIEEIWIYRLQYLKCKAKRKTIKKGKETYQMIENWLLH